MGAVAFPVAVGVLQNHDAIASSTRSLPTTIVDTFRDPDATSVIDVHVRRVVEERSASPHGHFQ